MASREYAQLIHLTWGGAHALVAICGIRYVLGRLLLSSDPLVRYYRLAYAAAVVSYGLVTYRAFANQPYTRATLQRALMDENVQYVLMALIWLWVKPIWPTLLPYITFSAFHFVSFLGSTIIPLVAPPPQPASKRASGAGAPPPAQSPAQGIYKAINRFTKTYYESAMVFVAYAEVFILVRVLVGAIIFQNSWLLPLAYAHFLRLRFYMSTFTRASIQRCKAELDAYTQHQACPEAVRKVYLLLTDVIARYASNVLNFPHPQGAPSSTSAGGAGPSGSRSSSGAYASGAEAAASASAAAAGGRPRKSTGTAPVS
ncbi:Transmembrane nucleoporin [Tilletia horrida]|uniref:Transmembrane nucleoporin n=1 Tax=Tilletia horrida TaxID=155126 RepID=A0AAN6GDY5_9BASI|nr:Transmembrane nucleoporin [Tilletia horrida]KAK0535975.1 Transmembrane nucleoporin [Tilletia horrida]KAK0536304.1 Transmembrane nucleoporin [Tilletia horrida]KAK0560192.1 Transmembrane nucleoporin [Tilletia horrida]